jgi:hypothetical protein
MKKILITLAICLILVGMMAVPAMAAKNINLNVFQDVSDGGVELRDTIGTGSFGFANTNQNANGDLRVVGALKGAAPNTMYYVIIWAGPDHDGAITAMYSGNVTTNVQGNANTGAISIPAASLYGGSGYTGVGHIDFDNASTTGTYVATGISYIVP